MSHLALLGGSGFIGSRTIRAAVADGHRVTVIVRSETSAERVRALGATAVPGNAAAPAEWLHRVAEADLLVDLVQPALPRRLTAHAIDAVAHARLAGTQVLLQHLGALPAGRQPLLVMVSSTDDLAPDDSGTLSERSPLRTERHGFGHIGVPVRMAVEASGVPATFVYFGNIVYGPGKAYRDVILPAARAGKGRIIGTGVNHLPLTHVDDAAAALAHLATVHPAALAGQTIVAVPGEPATQRDLLALTAALLGAPAPRQVPVPLARIFAGSVAVETMTLDADCDPSWLTARGYAFGYESLEAGLAATIAELGITAETRPG